MADSRVVVLGLARQGLAVTRHLAGTGARVTVSDLGSEDKLRAEIAELAGLPVDFVMGGHPPELLDNCSLLVLSGGVPPQTSIVQEAIARGIPLTNDGLLTLQMAHDRGLGPLVAVTGSSGKTTTSTLTGLMLENGSRTVHVGGNIGTPLVDKMDGIGPGEAIVLEFSSFQLELFDAALTQTDVGAIGPQFACITNITPNHLDRHPSMAAYVAAKFNLIHTLPPGATLVVNLDDPVLGALLPSITPSASVDRISQWELEEIVDAARTQIRERGIRIVPFSLRRSLPAGAALAGDSLTIDGDVICERKELLVRGEHNIANMLAAAALSRSAGAGLASIRTVAKSFKGVPHRLEIVDIRDGITWVNDSIATAPERAVAALRSFDDIDGTIILLAGGKDKNLPWDKFAAEAVKRVAFLIGFGESGPIIVNRVREHARFSRRQSPGCATVLRLDEAVSLAAKIATPGAIVLLSPGGTSFDAYKDFEERGEHYRRLVRGLQRSGPTADSGKGIGE